MPLAAWVMVCMLQRTAVIPGWCCLVCCRQCGVMPCMTMDCCTVLWCVGCTASVWSGLMCIAGPPDSVDIIMLCNCCILPLKSAFIAGCLSLQRSMSNATVSVCKGGSAAGAWVRLSCYLYNQGLQAFAASALLQQFTSTYFPLRSFQSLEIPLLLGRQKLSFVAFWKVPTTFVLPKGRCPLTVRANLRDS